LTLVDAILILITIIWGMVVIWPHMKWIALANIPYLLWVTTATILQFQIAWMNR
jgi:tryptophan-rich sensory protein